MIANVQSRNESRAVVTVAIGAEGKAMLAESRQSLENYAHRCRADFLVIDRPSGKYSLPHYERFEVSEVLRNYGRVLYLDSDVLALPDAQDIFSAVPIDSLGATFVYSPPMQIPPAIEGFRSDINIASSLYGSVGQLDRYFNAGVLLFGRHHVPMLLEASALSEGWSSSMPVFHDQTLLNYLVLKRKLRVEDLGPCFNFTNAFGHSSGRFFASLIHYAGEGHRWGSRRLQMRKDWQTMSSPAWLRLRRTLPRVSDALERLQWRSRS
jgi:lipopolysaccharide biosynthesis glycosyltransferase